MVLSSNGNALELSVVNSMYRRVILSDVDNRLLSAFCLLADKQ